jgi:ribosome-binding factor A
MSKEDEDKVMKSIGILPPAKNFRLKSTPTIHLASDQSQRVQKTVKKVVDKSKNSI